MTISVYGNKNPFQISNQIDMLEITLQAPRYSEADSIFTISYGTKAINITASDFVKLSKSLQGELSQLNLTFALSRLQVEQDFANSFLSKSLTEISLFKSIFLIYDWVGLAFTDAYAVDLGSKVYDEFIIDFTNKPGPQTDIYFIKYQYNNSSNLQMIKRLIELNLLVKLRVGDDVLGFRESYFISLLKPGVSRTFFANEADKDGDKTYKLWKSILDDRDLRLRYWEKNRF